MPCMVCGDCFKLVMEVSAMWCVCGNAQSMLAMPHEVCGNIWNVPFFPILMGISHMHDHGHNNTLHQATLHYQ